MVTSLVGLPRGELEAETPREHDPLHLHLRRQLAVVEEGVLFKAEICVISSLSEDYCHVVTPPEVWGIELRTRLYLGHYHEFHYVSTRPTN